MKHENNNGVYYDLPDRFSHEHEDKYHGCGNGSITIDKASGAVIDMAYLDEDDKPMPEQNIMMHPKAGEILDENDFTITYRANFSCWQACLF